jgi:hypothetical protein
MNVAETCSCGASFAAEGDGVVRLLKEWRKAHPCHEANKESTSELVFSSSSAQVETLPMGFAPTEHPGRQDFGLE